MGYISGYRLAQENGGKVKHIIVNGAFNHGNSGGPLLVSRQIGVVGVVVSTYHFYPLEVKQAIDALSGIKAGVMMGTIKNADGSTRPLLDGQLTAMVLSEFYQKTQVMIGEAIAVSELKALLAEKQAEIKSNAPTRSRK